MKVKLWSIQEESKIEELSSSGAITTLNNKYSQEWDWEYKWMAMKLEDKIGASIVKDQYPIWAWYQHYSSKKKKPDLRKSGYLPKGTKCVRIEFEKQSKDILLSDFGLWHIPLGYKSYIGRNDVETVNFDRMLRKLNLDKTNYHELPINIKNEIEESWALIFDLNFYEEYWTHKEAEKKIQACCWQINESEVVQIDKFVAR